MSARGEGGGWRGASWSLLLGALACAHAPAATPQAAARGEVIVAPEAMQEGEVVLAAWLAYGVAKAELYGKSSLPPANESADDFTLELGARQAQSEFWAQKRDKPHAIFDRQVEIWRAGFLPELVLLVHGHPGWTIPAAAVDKLKNEAFITRFAGDYKPGAPVAVKPASGKLVPDEPGADFPDPQGLPVDPASCAKAGEERQQAWKRWQALVPRLGGQPIAADTPLQLGRQLLVVRGDAAYAGKPITWVSLRVAHLAMLEGYCAVERQDWAAAVRYLGQAASLAPAESTPRLELALALASLKRPREALAEVDRVLAHERDGCAAALAWRRRGYVLFELGALRDARTAYETSLLLEPGSRVARDELATIEAEEKKRGKGAGVAFPAPPVELLRTQCTR
jgi:hypothetical protein